MRRRSQVAFVAALLLVGLVARAEPGQGNDALGDPLPNGAVMRLGTMRFRHSGQVYAVAYSPDGSVLASCGEDKSVRIWDPGSGREIRRFTGHSKAVYSFAFAGDGKRMVSVGGDNTMRVWDVATGAETAKQEVAIERLGAVAVSRDGTLVAAAGEGRKLALWRMSGNALSEMRRAPADRVRTLAFSPDGSILAVAGDPGQVTLVDVTDGHVLRTLAGHAPWTTRVAFSADGRVLATSGRDAKVRLWDAGTGQEVRQFEGCDFVANGVCFSPDGTRIAAAGHGGDVFVWESGTGKGVWHFTGDAESVNDLAFSPDGKTLAAGSYDIRLFDLETGKPRFSFDGHREDVRALAFSPDGTILASGGGHSAVFLWSVKTGAVEKRLAYRNLRVADLAFSPDGKRLAAAIDLFRLRVWDPGTGDVIVDRERRERQGMTSHVAFSSDGKLLAWSGYQIVSLVDGLNGTDVRAVPFADTSGSPSPLGSPRALAFRGRPERLHVATESGILFIGLDGGAPRKVILDDDFFRCAAWSEDGGLSALGVLDAGVQLRHARTGRTVRTIEDDGTYDSLRFAADGRLLVGVGARRKVTMEKKGRLITHTVSLDEGLIRTWNVASGRQVAELPGHDGPVRCVAISPDGKLLATGGADTTVLLWDLAR